HHDLACVQIEAGDVRPRGAAIDAVADDGPSHGSAMHAQLMGAAGERLERKPSEVMAFVAGGGRTSRASHHLPRGHRRLTRGIVLHPPAAWCVLSAEAQLAAALLL